MHFRLIVGLGNPGREYRQTRHNVGFMLLDQMAGVAGICFRHEKPWRAEMAKLSGSFLCKPLSYMNLSGEVVRTVSEFYKIGPEEILVVLDDLALPLGKIRLRASGSAGGHNGLKSIIGQLGTANVARVRIGIGAPAEGAATGHVLGRFSEEELPFLRESLNRAQSAIECAQAQGFGVAMNSYN